jgi:hypothetical protein
VSVSRPLPPERSADSGPDEVLGTTTLGRCQWMNRGTSASGTTGALGRFRSWRSVVAHNTWAAPGGYPWQYCHWQHRSAQQNPVLVECCGPQHLIGTVGWPGLVSVAPPERSADSGLGGVVWPTPLTPPERSPDSGPCEVVWATPLGRPPVADLGSVATGSTIAFSRFRSWWSGVAHTTDTTGALTRFRSLRSGVGHTTWSAPCG